MGSAYRSVLRRGDVLSALVPYVLARLPLTMAPLALLLLTQHETGSYHRAGFVCGAYAIAVAAAAPLLGRLVDRHGQSRVLLVAGILHAASMVVAATVAPGGHYALLVLAAVAAGCSLPPVTACMRVLWTKLLPDEASRQAGFAIDGVVVEVAELSGPLLVSLLLVLGRPATAVAVSGLVMGIAAVVFRSTRASRSVPPANVRRSPWGALAVPGVRRLLLVVASSTATIGAVEVAITAFARHHGGMSSAGLYIGVISVGGIAAGLFFGGTDRIGRRHPVTVLVAMLLLSTTAAACLAAWSAPALVVVTLFFFGAAVSVGVIVQLATMSAIVGDAIRTEAFTWGATANFVGLGLGTAVCGWVIDRYGLSTAFVVAAGPTALAALLAAFGRSAWHAAAESVESAAEPAVADGAEMPEAMAAIEEPASIDDLVTTGDVAASADAAAVVPVSSVEAVVPVQRVASAPPDVAALAEEVASLRAHVSDLEAALAAALDAPSIVVGDARDRARRMLDRADAACLEMRERATDDADRVREAATTASLEILSAAERDARAMLERARREADAIMTRARRVADAAATPSAGATLHALPGFDAGHQAAADGGRDGEADSRPAGDEVAAGS